MLFAQGAAMIRAIIEGICFVILVAMVAMLIIVTLPGCAK